jgi:catechol 2,3-dioxygenase-like lactoylglutathione lyase family enzyme
MESLINNPNGYYVDHIAIAVDDTKKGVEWITELTGVRPTLDDPEPGQFYWSGVLAIGKDSFLEIIGPNPNHKGFHPFKQILKEYKVPKLAFWYVSTNKFDEVQKLVESNGFKIENVVKVAYKRDGNDIDYKRAGIGPGFRSEIPNLIQWNKRSKVFEFKKKCFFKSLELVSPESERLNKLFEILDITMRARNGKPSMKLKIGTPKGELVLEGGGFEFVGIKAIFKMIRLYFKYLLRI